MATTIEYKNEFGNEVTQNQLPLLKDYTKIEKIDDSLKSEELYVDGIISRVDYQKSQNETISEILSKYAPETAVHITTHFENFGIYKMGYIESYMNNNILSKSRFLKNGENKIILSQDIDKITNTPIPNTIKKYFSFTEDEYYLFDYKDDGTLREMNSTRGINYGVWISSDLNNLNGFSWSEVGNYYQTSQPVIPENLKKIIQQINYI